MASRFVLVLGLALAAVTDARPGELVRADAARVLEEVRRPGARAVLVNIWATWCQPCREELPDLVRLQRAYTGRGLRLVLVSGDFDSEAAAAGRMLAELGVEFPTFLKSGGDMEFIDGLDRRWSGALPATFVYDSAGQLRHFWEGKADYARLEGHVLELLGPKEGS